MNERPHHMENIELVPGALPLLAKVSGGLWWSKKSCSWEVKMCRWDERFRIWFVLALWISGRRWDESEDKRWCCGYLCYLWHIAGVCWGTFYSENCSRKFLPGRMNHQTSFWLVCARHSDATSLKPLGLGKNRLMKSNTYLYLHNFFPKNFGV